MSPGSEIVKGNCKGGKQITFHLFIYSADVLKLGKAFFFSTKNKLAW